MIHLTTADNNDGAELITPAQIAAGAGDRYLVRLNKLFYEKGMRAYVRPLGEPNRCLNVYAAYDCAGASRGPEHSPRAYKQAFRRIYVVVHGGGKARAINRRLAEAGLPPLTVSRPRRCRRPRWRSSGARCPPARRPSPENRPKHFYPGSRWVDWAGTDFYAGYPEWKALTGLYRRFSGKPFAITEWAVESGDDPSFVNKLFAWVKSHRRTAGCSSTTRTSATPTATGSRTTDLASTSSAPASTRAFPCLCAGCASPTAATPRWGWSAVIEE